MSLSTFEGKLRTLVGHAWDDEIRWPHIESWVKNFTGKVLAEEEEQLYALFSLSRFMYFSRRMTREMLRSLYRDHFRAQIIQRIRRNYGNTRDCNLLSKLFDKELAATRFLGVGNPAESGAHLLYFFRQVNYLSKDLFIDISEAFEAQSIKKCQTVTIEYTPRDPSVSRYVFFDDLVGSGNQASTYLAKKLSQLRRGNKNIDVRFMSLFATSTGLKRLNAPSMFDGKAICLFELDSQFKAFDSNSRHFINKPEWFKIDNLNSIAHKYGTSIQPKIPLGYDNGQLLLGFSHNTPNNTLPIFWDEGHKSPWSPVFLRYDKKY